MRTAFALGVNASGGSVQDHGAGLSVAPRPFRYDVGHDASVVVWSQREFAAGGSADVDPVHPRIPGVDHIGEVSTGPLLVEGPSGPEPRGWFHGRRLAAGGEGG